MLIKDIAEKTGIGESTIRFYINKFPEYIHFRMEGRRKKYAPEAPEIIKYISDRYAEQWTAEQIRMGLEKKYGRVIEVNYEDHLVSAAPSSITIESVAEIIKQNSMLLEKTLEYERRMSDLENVQQ